MIRDAWNFFVRTSVVFVVRMHPCNQIIFFFFYFGAPVLGSAPVLGRVINLQIHKYMAFEEHIRRIGALRILTIRNVSSGARFFMYNLP